MYICTELYDTAEGGPSTRLCGSSMQSVYRKD